MMTLVAVGEGIKSLKKNYAEPERLTITLLIRLWSCGKNRMTRSHLFTR